MWEEWGVKFKVVKKGITKLLKKWQLKQNHIQLKVVEEVDHASVLNFLDEHFFPEEPFTRYHFLK